MVHLANVGDTIGDSSCDDNNDLKIDGNWLDVQSANIFLWMDRDYFDTSSAGSISVIYSDDVDTQGTEIASALGSRTSDSIGIDVDGGAFDYYLYPAYIREGANITFTVDGDTLSIAGSAGSSSLTVVTKTGNYTATTSDDVILCNGTFTITLYTASGNTGKVLHIKNIGTGTTTVDGHSTETMDGELSFDIENQYDAMMIVSDGTNWHII